MPLSVGEKLGPYEGAEPYFLTLMCIGTSPCGFIFLITRRIAPPVRRQRGGLAGSIAVTSSHPGISLNLDAVLLVLATGRCLCDPFAEAG